LKVKEENPDRYSRQVIFREIGKAGQEKLKAASVLVAGVGGLGGVSAQYLCRAGIGKLTVVDSQDVQITDLNRQILYSEGDIGRGKTVVAEKMLSGINSCVKIMSVKTKISGGNSISLLEDVDIVVDGTDNFETRFLLNEACHKKGIPLIYGGIFGLKGSVMTIIPGQTPCLACFLSEEDTPDDPIPAIGPFVGTIATIQAMEVLKLIIGFGEPLAGTLLKFDGRNARTRKIAIKKKADCSVCSAD
jgi:molybdopterin/thiamine biosynthesis adenylyltransferase